MYYAIQFIVYERYEWVRSIFTALSPFATWVSLRDENRHAPLTVCLHDWTLRCCVDVPLALLQYPFFDSHIQRIGKSGKTNWQGSFYSRVKKIGQDLHAEISVSRHKSSRYCRVYARRERNWRTAGMAKRRRPDEVGDSRMFALTCERRTRQYESIELRVRLIADILWMGQRVAWPTQ